MQCFLGFDLVEQGTGILLDVFVVHLLLVAAERLTLKPSLLLLVLRLPRIVHCAENKGSINKSRMVFWIYLLLLSLLRWLHGPSFIALHLCCVVCIGVG